MPRREQLLEMLKADPEDVFLHYALAMDDISEGRPDDGIQRLQVVLQRDPDYVAAYFQMGQVLADQDVDAARSILTQGIQAAQRVGNQHASGEMQGFLETLG